MRLQPDVSSLDDRDVAGVRAVGSALPVRLLDRKVLLVRPPKYRGRAAPPARAERALPRQRSYRHSQAPESPTHRSRHRPDVSGDKPMVSAGLKQCHAPLRAFNSTSCAAGHPGTRRPRGPVDDTALHAPQSGSNGRRDPVARRATIWPRTVRDYWRCSGHSRGGEVKQLGPPSRKALRWTTFA